jgi:phosphoglycerol transferase MdoB-like AlkP superfamily enzyme
VRNRLKLFGTLGLLWMAFFAVGRVLFMLYQWSLTTTLSFRDTLLPHLLGLRMDAAMTGYWLIVPGLSLVLSFYNSTTAKWLIILSFYGFALISAGIIIADLELYHHWGFRMDTTPLLYTGSEGFGSVSIWRLIFLLILFLILAFGFQVAFRKFIFPKLEFKKGSWTQSVLMFGCVALLFIPIRSSFRVAPLNTGVVYFHKTNPYPNHAGINVVWNFLKSVVSDNSFRYPTNLLDAELADQTFNAMMAQPGAATQVLNTQKPNVLLIVLEGFTAKVIEPLGGLKDITPNLNKLCAEGILFDEFYASGDRTDKGIISILSGYPAQPKTSIIKYPNKTQSLPSLPKVLTKKGYHTSFIYGGDIGFANMESYVTIAGFSHITEDNDFDLSLNVSKWGVHDGFVFNRLLSETDSAHVPFFKTMLSLSSHEPFDVPSGLPEKKDEESLFLNSCTYTDKSLGDFIRQAKQKSWWTNTLVIITADHGHRLPGKSAVHEKEKFKIPMLWLGGVVDSVKRIHTIGNQTDLVNTLLSQLGIQSVEFTFSKNLLNSGTQSFAVYSFNNGYGYLAPGIDYVYDFDLMNYISRSGAAEKDFKAGKSYMQKLFNDYNER